MEMGSDTSFPLKLARVGGEKIAASFAYTMVPALLLDAQDEVWIELWGATELDVR